MVGVWFLGCWGIVGEVVFMIGLVGSDFLFRVFIFRREVGWGGF